MNLKKILSVATLTVVLGGGLFVLTGCGDESASNNNTNNAADTTNQTNNTAQVVQAPFNIINNVPNTTIKELYLSGAGLETWGAELLKGAEMPTGTQLSVVLTVDQKNLKWDIKAIDEEGTAAYFRNLDLSEVSANGGTITLAVVDGTLVATAQ